MNKMLFLATVVAGDQFVWNVVSGDYYDKDFPIVPVQG